MIFEIYACQSGRTQGYREGESVAKETCRRINPIGPDGLVRQGAPMHDYLPARPGFYIADTRGFVKGGPLEDRSEAQRRADALNRKARPHPYHVTAHELA